MNEEYKNGYRDGFKDGFEAGRKSVPLEPVKSNPPLRLDDIMIGVHQPPSVPEWPRNANDTCPKCGMKVGGVMGYVCVSPNCPTFPQATSSELSYR